MRIISAFFKGAYTFLRLTGFYPPYELSGVVDEFLEIEKASWCSSGNNK